MISYGLKLLAKQEEHFNVLKSNFAQWNLIKGTWASADVDLIN